MSSDKIPDFSHFRHITNVDDIIEGKMQMLPGICPGYTAVKPSNDGGIAHLHLDSYMDDVTLGRLDAEAAAASFMRTPRKAQLMDQLIAMGTALDPPMASTVYANLNLPEPASRDIAIPQYTGLLGSGGSSASIPFVTTRETDRWVMGSARASVLAIQGEQFSYVCTDNCTGRESERYFIPIENVLSHPKQQTCRVLVSLGGAQRYFTVIYNWFAFSGPRDEHAMLVRTGTGRTWLLFGDGRRGKRPPRGATIQLDGLNGGGSVGNIGPHAVNRLADTLYDGETQLSVTVDNPDSASPGRDEQTMTEAKHVKPFFWKAQARGVNIDVGDDIAGILKGDDGPAGLLDAASYHPGGNLIRVAIVADTTSGYPSGALLTAAQQTVDAAKMTTDVVRCEPAVLVNINVGTILSVVKGSRVDPDALVGKGHAAILAWFSLQRRATLGGNDALFGRLGSGLRYIFRSRLSDYIDNIEGVYAVDFEYFYRTPTPVLSRWNGDATFSPVTVSPATVEEVWTVCFKTHTMFQVSGSASGGVGRGTVGVAFSDHRGRIAFTISNSGTAMKPRDTATFRTSPLLGNPGLDPLEVARAGVIAPPTIQEV